MLCADEETPEEESTQDWSAFYDYFFDAPTEGYVNGFPHQAMNMSMMCTLSHSILI